MTFRKQVYTPMALLLCYDRIKDSSMSEYRVIDKKNNEELYSKDSFSVLRSMLSENFTLSSIYQETRARRATY